MVVVGVLGASWTAGCGGGGSRAQAGAAAGISTAMVIPEGAKREVASAKADAARRTGTPARAWEVVQVTPRSWPDTGLGCPAPDGIYAQVITPGYLIELRSGDRSLEYHTGAGQLVYCNG